MSNTAPLSQFETGRRPTLDWLHVVSEYANPVPVVCSVLSDHTEIETGLVFRTWRAAEVAGSWQSTVAVKSDGRTVAISGNPSRWGRPENLGGCRSLLEGLQVFDAILASVGLPGISPHATIRRMDWARNLRCGRGQERAFLRWVSGQTLRGKRGVLYPDGLTCAFVGRKSSRKVYVKYYAKGPELRVHHRGVDPVQRAWRERCADWCDEEGVVRHEVTVRGDWLDRRGVRSVQRFLEAGDSEGIVDAYAVEQRAEVAADPFGDVRAKLMDRGHGEREAGRLELAVRAWASGGDLRKAMSRASYYRARRALLPLGWDIANPFEVSRCVSVVPVVCVGFAGLPSWYAERDCLAAAA